MKPRLLGIGWVAVTVLFLALLASCVSKWTSLSTEVVRVRTERQRLTSEIQLREQQLVAEMRRNSELLNEMQWTSSGGDPSTFLGRMAALAREKRMKVTAIGPLERQTSPQFTKSWHTIQVQAPYREIRELAMRVEQDRGILEDVRLEAVPAPAGQAAGPTGAAPPPREDVQARFRMTALELSPQAKLVIDRAVAASGSSSQVGPKSALALPVPTMVAQGGPTGRDPFTFLFSPPSARTAPGPATHAAADPGPPSVPLDVKGIVSFPEGYLAIVNNQIVKVGDTVSGHRVERITEDSVTLLESGATAARTVNLPDLAPTAPAAPRR